MFDTYLMVTIFKMYFYSNKHPHLKVYSNLLFKQ